MHPHGVLKACIFFEDELIPMGYLRVFNDMGVIDYLDWIELIDGCKDIFLTPGHYEISAKYFQGVCADTGSGCLDKGRYTIDIEDGEVIELDMEVFFPE